LSVSMRALHGWKRANV
jgi:hypothetical protein